MEVPRSIVDVNVHVFAWPFRHLRLADPRALARELPRLQVAKALVGSLEAVFHRDVDGVNRRLAQVCRESQRVESVGGQNAWIPCGTVHPGLTDWEEDLRRCDETYRMPVVRLYPNYHQYRLDSDLGLALLDACRRRRLLVQIVMSLEDRRTQHPLVRVPPVPLESVQAVASRFPEMPLMLLNAFRETRLSALAKLCRRSNIYLDLATLEGAGSVERVLESIPASRLCYGSNLPLFYGSAARLKLSTAGITERQRTQIASTNVRSLLNTLRRTEAGQEEP